MGKNKDNLIVGKEMKNDNSWTKGSAILWLGISVGQPYHENEAMKSSLHMLSKRFQEAAMVNVGIVDEMQRYTLGIKHRKSPDEMRLKAVQNGQEWKRKYEGWIQDAFHPCEINFFTCDFWCKHDLYSQARDEIDELYGGNAAFKSLVEENILEFERRHFNREHVNFDDSEREYCRKYLKEECSMLIVWDRNCVYSKKSFLFYPKTLASSIVFVLEHFTELISVSANMRGKKNGPCYNQELLIHHIAAN